MIYKNFFLVTGILLLICKWSYSQDQSAPVNTLIGFPIKFIEKTQTKFLQLDNQLTRQTERYLLRLAKKEEKLQRKLQRLNPTAAQRMYAGTPEKYSELANKFKADHTVSKHFSGEYLPFTDSVQTSLSFLQQQQQFPSFSKQIQSSLSAVGQFQSKLQRTEKIKAYIKQRRDLMKASLSQYTHLPKSVTNCYKSFNKEFYYYQAQLNEYKQLLKNPDKLTRKALTVLNRSSEFQQFAQKYSQLAGLFNLPGNYATNLAGLQTRTQVQQIIQTRFASQGSGATQILQQNLQTARTQMQNIKNKITQLGGGDMDMPEGFKPNPQKTKTFLQRIELGTNFQTTRSNNFFPGTVDMGLSAGYKISNKSIVGVGMSYKLGLGRDYKHIDITQQGIGLRSFLDIKLKGSFFASGGLEYNYVTPFEEIQQLYDINQWQQSALIGISKVVSLNNKFFKKTKAQLLWDVLSYQQIPRSQPIKFRIGYSFK